MAWPKCLISVLLFSTLLDACSADLVNRENEPTSEPIVPDYYMEHLKEKEKQIMKAIQVAGSDCVSFVFFTDAHWGNNQKNSPALINHITHLTPVRDVVFGGDVITTYFEDPHDAFVLGKEFQRAFDSLDCNMYYIYGNHDNNSDTNPNLHSRHLSEDQVYEYLQSRMGPCVYGGYYNFYFDREERKTRIICLDTGRFYYSQFRDKTFDTVSYLMATLQSTPDEWRIILISHLWTELQKDADGIRTAYVPAFHRSFLDLFDAYNNRSVGLFYHRGSSIKYDFSGATSKIVCCIGGHNHLDALLYSSGGIPIIINTTDSSQTINGDLAKKGTIEEQSVSVFVIDYSHSILNRFRVGRGNDLTIDVAL